MGRNVNTTATATQYAGRMRVAREIQYRTIPWAGPIPRAAPAWLRHNKNPDSAKKTATARSNRPPQIRPRTGTCVAPVWNATCVTSTPSAARPRIPSSAGMKLRGIAVVRVVAEVLITNSVPGSGAVTENSVRVTSMANGRCVYYPMGQMRVRDC